MQDEVKAAVVKLTLPSYPVPEAEAMPMFAENRVHQRTSGNPYPNSIVQRVDRSKKVEQDYDCICLENRYLKLQILPQFGGRIYSAFDKRTGYDFVYKNHVIKPALIGCLGSWNTGGMEFNWPFHHRPSSFMPTDYFIENEADGAVVVWLSEHEPFDRMKGMHGICLRPDEAIFETRMRLANRTPLTKSFMWWENCGVPANKNYQIFYPQDVNHVHFHYKRSVTTFPIASNALGVYNGIRFPGDTDITLHKNTTQPTSYFSAASKYDFFGGYDHARQCGIVHVSNHHTSSGKKLFTWAYNQLSTSWENAMTDTIDKNGNPVIINAELMAGSYSDNQPDFSWLAPYETKCFAQFWFPIGSVGVPVFANQSGAIAWDKDRLAIQTTKSHARVHVVVSDGQDVIHEASFALEAGQIKELPCGLRGIGCQVAVTAEDMAPMIYTEEKRELYNIPDPISDMPNHKEVKTAQELYLEGVHVWQYRDPAVLPDAYWKEALLRDGEHIDSLLALSACFYSRAFYAEALTYVQKAFAALSKYNKRPQSGQVYYLLGLIHDKLGQQSQAYDAFNKASWNMDCVSAAMTQISAIDGRRADYAKMAEHCLHALRTNADNPIAQAYLAIAYLRAGQKADCTAVLQSTLSRDPLNHLARYVCVLCGIRPSAWFYDALKSDPSQTCLDIAFDLQSCGQKEAANALLLGLADPAPMVCYVLEDYQKAAQLSSAKTFPFRLGEEIILEKAAAAVPTDGKSPNYLGCWYYSKGHFAKGAAWFQTAIDRDPSFYMPYRNLAVACFSHLGKKAESLNLLKKALQLKPHDYQLVFETAYVMAKLGIDPAERIDFMLSNTRGKMEENVCIELAKAYNQNDQPEKTISLYLEQTFVACEGGEHALVEPYMLAYHQIGRSLMKDKQYGQALEAFRKAQILPQQFGAGLWNECKLVPHQYYEAQCLDALGQTEAAEAIYRHILCLKVDYFTQMYQKDFPYYLALSHRRMGDELMGRAVMDQQFKLWNRALQIEDPGYFATTPFFISYCDDAKTARTAQFTYLIGLAGKYAGESEQAYADLSRSTELDPSSLYAFLERKF
jgi:tetratricopeptide (TPR) repeat protein